MDLGHINSLAELLTPSDNQEEELQASTSSFNPGLIGATGSASTKGAGAKKEGSKDIWDEDEVPDFIEDDLDDGKECPRYDFLYKQAVATEDVYLGMSDKDPSSTSCEDLVLKVYLEGTQSMAELDLDVEDTHVKVRSPRYKLGLHLPHKTNSERGFAKWDKKAQVLTITLPIVREDPF